MKARLRQGERLQARTRPEVQGQPTALRLHALRVEIGADQVPGRLKVADQPGIDWGEVRRIVLFCVHNLQGKRRLGGCHF